MLHGDVVQKVVADWGKERDIGLFDLMQAV